MTDYPANHTGFGDCACDVCWPPESDLPLASHPPRRVLRDLCWLTLVWRTIGGFLTALVFLGWVWFGWQAAVGSAFGVAFMLFCDVTNRLRSSGLDVLAVRWPDVLLDREEPHA